MEKFLEELDSLLKQVCSLGPDHSGLRHKANQMAQKLHKHQEEIRSGKLVINTVKSFWVFWSDGQASEITGYDVADAFRKAGYGSVAAVDFYSEIKYGNACLEGKITFPSKFPAREMVANHYAHEIKRALLNLQDSVSERVYAEKLGDFLGIINDLQAPMWKGSNDDVAATLRKVYDGLFRNLTNTDGAIHRVQ